MGKEENVSPVEAELIQKMAKDAISKAKNDLAIRMALDAAVQAEFPTAETEEVVDKPLVDSMHFQIDGVSVGQIGSALASSQTSVELRSLVEIASEIEQLLLLTDEQELDTLALRKLKRALTRKHLAQVRDEILMMDKAIAREMGEEYWRLCWEYWSRTAKLPLRLQY